MDIDEAKSLGQDIDPIVRIGKKGLTKGMITELDRHLENDDLIKIKVLRNNPIQDIEKLGNMIEEKTIGKVIEIKGKTILLLNKEEL